MKPVLTLLSDSMSKWCCSFCQVSQCLNSQFRHSSMMLHSLTPHRTTSVASAKLLSPVWLYGRCRSLYCRLYCRRRKRWMLLRCLRILWCLGFHGWSHSDGIDEIYRGIGSGVFGWHSFVGLIVFVESYCHQKWLPYAAEIALSLVSFELDW